MTSDLAFRRYAAPAPTPYHTALANTLERRSAETWAVFASDKSSVDASDALRLDLLKSTYRLERGSHEATHGALYDAADEIAAAMEIDAPVTLYQADGGLLSGRARNAALYFEPTAIHIVFSGDLLAALTGAEMRFVLGHEIAHHKLWSLRAGRHWAAHRLVNWAKNELAREGASAESWSETARIEQLFTELYADRYGLWAVGDLDPALSAQIKIATGLDEASGAAFLAQAEEALAATTAHSSEAARAEGETHPEGYIRAALLAAWAHDPQGAEARSRALIEGAMPLTKLDLLGQERLCELTNWFLLEFLVEPWRTRERFRAHAYAISPALGDALSRPHDETDDIDGLRTAIAAAHVSVQEYLAYLLLDFATIDPQLDDVMLAWAISFSEDFGLISAFKAIAAKELKTTRTKLTELERNADAIIKRAVLSLQAFDDDRVAAIPARPRPPAASDATGDAA